MGHNACQLTHSKVWRCAQQHRWFACGLVAGAAGLVLAQEAQFRGIGLLPFGYPTNVIGNCLGNLPGNGPGNLPGNTVSNIPPNCLPASSWMYDMSADGNTVVGTYDGCCYFEAFKWTPAGGMKSLPAASLETIARAVSADGQIVFGRAVFPGQTAATRWVNNGPVEMLRNSFGGAVLAFTPIAVSDDGKTLIAKGFRGPEKGDASFVWRGAGTSTSGTYSELQTQFADSRAYSDARTISASGTVIAGTTFVPPSLGFFEESRAAVWVSSTIARHLVLYDPFSTWDFATAVSGDGLRTFGVVNYFDLFFNLRQAPAVWLSFASPDGFPRLLSLADPTFVPIAANYDGTVVAGEMTIGFARSPAVWIEGRGTVPLLDLMAEDGIDPLGDGWVIATIEDVSSDGLTFAGNGYHNGRGEPWWYRRPACPCPADFDKSGGTPDTADIAEFFNAWLAGDPQADTDCSGGTPDSTDIGVFFDAWLAGGC